MHQDMDTPHLTMPSTIHLITADSILMQADTLNMITMKIVIMDQIMGYMTDYTKK